jgi:hypothetical protein
MHGNLLEDDNATLTPDRSRFIPEKVASAKTIGNEPVACSSQPLEAGIRPGSLPLDFAGGEDDRPNVT